MKNQSHLFDVELAKQYGVKVAVMVRHFQFWITKNKSNKKHFHDGRTWTYCSVQALTKIHPYWTTRQVRVVLDKLIKEGILIKGNYNIKGYDNTTWYAFADERAFVNSDKPLVNSDNRSCQNGQPELPKPANGVVKTDKPIPNPIPVNNTDESTDQLKLTPQQRLELDLLIADEKKIFCEQISQIFRLNRREAITFVRIAQYLTIQCQDGRLKPAVFKEAIRWAREAKASDARNRKGLFVAKVKAETGYRASKKLLKRPQHISHAAANALHNL